ncbi:MAG: hypothetical protein M5U28_42035 [Sandaracinaceae bacterium]|nr:hypothetical protein [Sandaracinaceae bacterium]
MVTNDLREDIPLLPSQCNNPDRALVFLGGGASPSVSTGAPGTCPTRAPA